MNNKRFIGTVKIFLYYGGVVLVVAGIIWFIINGAFAVYLFSIRQGIYHGGTYDILTPGIIMAASMAVYYRYRKMCFANNVSGKMQIGIFYFLSLLCSAMFAGADLLFTKLVLQRICGGIVRTRLEMRSNYLSSLVFDYTRMFDEIPVSGSPYSTGIMLLIFAAMTLYYYCFWVIGSYFMCCFLCQKRKRLVYIGITTILVPVMLIYEYDIECVISSISYNTQLDFVLMYILSEIIFVGILSDPILFLFIIPELYSEAIWYKDFSSFISYIFVFAVFAFVMLLCTVLIDKVKSPGRRKIKRAIDDYYKDIRNKKENKNE